MFNDLVLTLLGGYLEVPLKASGRARTDLPLTSSDLKSHTELIHPPIQIPACICTLLQSVFIPVAWNLVWLCVYANAAEMES